MEINFLGQDGVYADDGQSIYFYLFLLETNPIIWDDFLEYFLQSKYFINDCLPFFIKKYPKPTFRYLKHAFREDQLKANDFRIFNKVELLNYFENYSNDESWGDDRNDYIVLMNNFKKIISKENCDYYFVINKEWFPNNSNKLYSDSADLYSYYFLILWIDVENKFLNVCEWNYD